MARHEFDPTRFHNAIGTAEPALTIADGDTVVAHTVVRGGSTGTARRWPRGRTR